MINEALTLIRMHYGDGPIFFISHTTGSLQVLVRLGED